MVQPEVDVASVYIDPPLDQPPAVAIPWAPPPMRWDPPPPQPYVEATWIGGHWTWWDGEWVWARGHWARPPSPAYVWCEPYYEYRGDAVVFVAGFWRPVVRVFVPPPPTVYVPLVQVRVVHVGYARPIGPHGVFVPAPPGSQPGVIVPAPVGTPPAVVLSAPPVVRPGMVVRPVPSRVGVEVVAPAGVTREGRPVTVQAPVLSRDAAAVHPVVVAAPPPMRGTATPPAVDRGPYGVGIGAAAPGRPTPATPETVGTEVQTGPIRRPFPSVNVPPSGQATPAPVPARPLSTSGEASGGQPVVRPRLRPEALGGEKGAPRPWQDSGDLRPVPSSRPEVAPRPPVRAEAPAAPAVAAPAAPPVEAAAPARPRPVPKRTPDEKKGHPERER